ncbi:hypothetical protein VP01_2015g2 [Puccinia sorghi]|uniref:Uncharacterized protein n=1 Tax=Puccinia sorghi TaxID=27349 RepID=A0A0L6VB44_9BASI|nr:hypothetical protein VP01_2015g2 [Puccinia sorghi]
MPSGASLGRCRFNSSAHPITIEITSFQHAPSPVSANNPEAISLTASPYRNPFKAQRPFTAESDNRTVCLELPEQADDTFQKKYPSVPSPADEDQGIEAILHSEQNNPNGGGGSEPRSTPYPTTRRLDLIILPLTSLIYLSDYVQRSNIGNAAAYGLKFYALGNSHLCYALVLSGFSLTYLSFSIGAIIMIPRSESPKGLLLCAVLLTSIATITIGFASNFGTIFIFCHRCGRSDCGQEHGDILLVNVSLIYPYRDGEKNVVFHRLDRFGWGVSLGFILKIVERNLCVDTRLASSNRKGRIGDFCKLKKLDSRNEIAHNGVKRFFIEGAQGIVLALACLFYLPSSIIKKRPETTSQVQIHTQGSLSEINSITLESHMLDYKLVLKALRDPCLWISSFSYGCVNLSVGSLTGYLPLIVQSSAIATVDRLAILGCVCSNVSNCQCIRPCWSPKYFYHYDVRCRQRWMGAFARIQYRMGEIFRNIFGCCRNCKSTFLILPILPYSFVSEIVPFNDAVHSADSPINSQLILSWTLSNCIMLGLRGNSDLSVWCRILMQTLGQALTVFSHFIFEAHDKDFPRTRLGYFINLVGNASAVIAVSCLAAFYYYKNSKNASQLALTNDMQKCLIFVSVFLLTCTKAKLEDFSGYQP